MSKSESLGLVPGRLVIHGKPLIIGVFGFVLQEILHRPFLGVLRYCEEVGGLVPRDFRTLNVIDDHGKVLAPPWRGRCDGLVVSTGRGPGMDDARTANWLLSGGVPAVSVSGDWRDPRIPCVHTDQRSAGELAARHLLECGCASFLYVGYARSTGSQQRGAAFCAEMQRAGRQVQAFATQSHLLALDSVEDDDILSHEPQLRELIGKLPKPLGLWTLNDGYAVAVCRLCLQLELDVPDQVRVLGTDDTALARAHWPALSSIRTDGEQIGYLAMKTLHRELEGKRVLRAEIEVPAAEVVVRRSTAGADHRLGTMAAAVEYIRRHACSGITVEHVAETVGMSRRSFTEQFRQRVGRLPVQEIQQARLERARELLQHVEISISRIGAMVGFEETAAFSKFFRKHTGLSPRQYRTRLATAGQRQPPPKTRRGRRPSGPRR